MTTIILKRAWKLGAVLDGGGFGRVFDAESDAGVAAVVKLIPKVPGASRELLFEELSGRTNIIPVWDSGEWEDDYVIVMPRAETSLREYMTEAGGKLGIDQAVAVLTDVATALASLNAGVIHRDLKPDNILLYGGHWCLADFGIARYAEATTAADTHKFSMTPPYAAPEQWRGERATAATDVYAFGVVAFELLQGELPFCGPDFRDQHLCQSPSAIRDCPPSLASLINVCLFKPPAARPAAANILARLQAIPKRSSPAVAKLQAINVSVVEKQGREAARESADQAVEEARSALFRAADLSLTSILWSLQESAREGAPATVVSHDRGLTLRLADGTLAVDPVQTAPIGCLAVRTYGAPFDVVAVTTIAVRRSRDRFGYEGRAHSLWYCDAHVEGTFRWFELAFMVTPVVPQRSNLDPFALPPTDEDAAIAFSPIMGTRQIAWQPLPFDQGDEGQFIERWLAWFAAAAEGTLSHPRSMPETSGGRYRSAQRRDR